MKCKCGKSCPQTIVPVSSPEHAQELGLLTYLINGDFAYGYLPACEAREAGKGKKS